jgi:hypothetical protein
MEKYGQNGIRQSGMEFIKRDVLAGECWRIRERLSKISRLCRALQEVLVRRRPNHRIGPYGLCIIFGYKMERCPSVFFNELHYHHYYH